MKKKLSKQLVNLAMGEVVASCTFIFAYVVSSGGRATFLSLAMLVFILLQGSGYWVFRYFILQGRVSPNSPVIINILRIQRKLDLVILLVLPVVIVYVNSGNLDLVMGIAIYLFALIEYINYYWYRLSYGKSGFNIRLLYSNNLQKSSIRRMLEQ